MRAPTASRIALAPHQLHAKPVVAPPHVVAQQQRSFVVVLISASHAPSLVKSPNGKTAGGKLLGKHRPALRAHIAKFFALVMKQQQRLPPLDSRRALVKQIVGKTVRSNQIKIPIVVIIEKLQPPSTHPARRHADASRHRHIVKGAIAVVLVEREELLDRCSRQTDPSTPSWLKSAESTPMPERARPSAL